MKKRIRMIVIVIAFFLVTAVLLYFFAGRTSRAQDVVWGVNFSPSHASVLGLDWKETYLSLLDDLEVKRVKISVDWDQIEPQKAVFFFDDVDWMVQEAEKRGVMVLPVVGMKTLRWPECHIPVWAAGLSKKEQQENIVRLLKDFVERYKDSPAIWAWQVENEPMFRFGECPWADRGFLEKEVRLVRSLDSSRKVVISDSGEFSLWFQAARIGDIVSTTMYRKVWFSAVHSYVEYPFPSVFYARKAQLEQAVFGDKVIVGELQAEPWTPGKLLYESSLSEQDQAFSLAQFRKNIEFAKNTGFDTFDVWGAEWWYWRKEKAGDPSFWTEARKLFI